MLLFILVSCHAARSVISDFFLISPWGTIALLKWLSYLLTYFQTELLNLSKHEQKEEWGRLCPLIPTSLPVPQWPLKEVQNWWGVNQNATPNATHVSLQGDHSLIPRHWNWSSNGCAQHLCVTGHCEQNQKGEEDKSASMEWHHPKLSSYMF